MQISGNATGMQLDLSAVVTRVQNIAEARLLPPGTVVGDMHGGVTFSDAVASELDRRSHCGWCDVSSGTNERRWTVILINR